MYQCNAHHEPTCIKRILRGKLDLFVFCQLAALDYDNLVLQRKYAFSNKNFYFSFNQITNINIKSIDTIYVHTLLW